MCRYAFSNYKSHYACFHCRKMFRQPPACDLAEAQRPAPGEHRIVPCPECWAPMNNMGLDFKAPPQDDVRQWMKVERLFHHGFAFHSCGCGGPGPRPAALRDVEAFLAENRPISEGERLLRAITTSAGGRDRKGQRLPGEGTTEHPLAADARKLRRPDQSARIAVSLLRKKRNPTT